MNTGWAPRPLRNLDTSGFVDEPLVIRPEEPTLYINKGSLVEKYDQRPQQPKQEPEDPMTTVKSYIAFKSNEAAPEPDKEMAKSVSAMNAAIAAFAAKAGVKSGS